MDSTPIDVAMDRTPLGMLAPNKYVNDGTRTTTSPPHVMDKHLGALVPYVGSSSNFSAADVDAGPSNVPTLKRGRGRPKGSGNSTSSTKRKKKNHDPNSKYVLSCPNFNSRITKEERENGNKKLVDSVLMRFDAVRRRFCQLGNIKGLLTPAVANCMKLGVRTNMKKRIGPVPGIEVGDIFYFWGEMCLVGLHSDMVCGIDHLTKKDSATEGSLATSVVSSGRYGDFTEDANFLVYTGHAAKDKDGVTCDQQLVKGNLAMKASHDKDSDVRVIRGVQDPCNAKRKIYMYDGLYSVVGFYRVKSKSGCKQFKFVLDRKPDQPPGYAVWKEVEKWKTNGLSSRKGLILEDLTNGSERLPVPLVNDVDENDKTVPKHFEYQRHSLNTSIQNRPIITCSNCEGQPCSEKDPTCVCVKRNHDELPYHDQILVCRRRNVHECGDMCVCAPDCKNRMVQNGLKLSLEVFKTNNCGWGLRTREPIRAGTFICEFAGLSMTGEIKEDDEYLFDTSRFYKRFKWNYEPELTNEDVWEQVSESFEFTSHMVISAKNSGNIGRFMNHSCNANVFWQPVEIERNKEMHLFIAFFAKKHIPPLTELRYDYGNSVLTEEIGVDGSKVFKGKKTCLCGFVNCRGSFG